MHLIPHHKSRPLLLVSLSLLQLFCTVQTVSSQQLITEPPQTSPMPSTALSVEATRLLEHIKTGTAAYNTKLKGGEIQFSLTLRQATHKPPPAGTDVSYVKKVYWHEETGYWHITYRFDRERQFYDVKARKKMELNGKSLPNWKETRYQYQIHAKTLYLREQIGTEWRQHPPQKMPSLLFKEQFNPRWWSWPPWGFSLTKLIHILQPVDCQLVNRDGDTHYYLTLQRTDPDSTRITEIWLDPQKDYHPIRILAHRKSVRKLWIRTADSTLIRAPSQKVYALTRYTYQLAHFEPDIWFPKTVTLESSFETGDEKQPAEPPPTFRKITMQVHRARFNIPIAEKDLRFEE